MKAFPKFLRSHFDLWTVFLAILYYSLLVGGPFFFLQTFIPQHCSSLTLPDKKGHTLASRPQKGETHATQGGRS